MSEKDRENICNSKPKYLTHPHSLKTDIFKKLTEGKRLKLKLSRAQSLGISNRSKQIKEKKNCRQYKVKKKERNEKRNENKCNNKPKH